MADEQPTLQATFELTDAQARTLLAYSYWKGFKSVDAAVRSMIDGAGKYMNSNGIKVEDCVNKLNKSTPDHKPIDYEIKY